MIENIKKIWKDLLDDETKNDVIEAIENEWDYKKDAQYLRARFFYRDKIPKERQGRVLEIMVNAYKLQEERKEAEKRALIHDLGL